MPKEQNINQTATQAPVPSPAEQIKHLLRTLTLYNKAFGMCRGKFGCVEYYEMLECPNPTASLRFFDAHFAAKRVMLNLLAKYKLWGWKQAYEELLAALTGNHVITGESFPVEQTTKGVLIMFQPEDTILLARWLYTTNYEDDVVHWLEHGKGKPERGLCGSLTPELFDRLPYIKEMFEERAKDKGRRLYNPSPTAPFFSKVVKDGWERLKPYEYVYGTNYAGKDRLWISPDPNHIGLWDSNSCIAFFIVGVDQDEIFRKYFPSRQEQKNIATWSFEFPTIIGDLTTSFCSPNMWIGIHPESEHNKWKNTYPSYVSKGVASGHGAIILNGSMYGNCLGHQYTRAIVPKYSDLEGPYPQHVNETGDIKNRRFTLAFPYRFSRE